MRVQSSLRRPGQKMSKHLCQSLFLEAEDRQGAARPQMASCYSKAEPENNVLLSSQVLSIDPVKKPSDCNLMAKQRPTFHKATDTERSNAKNGSLLATEGLEEMEQRSSKARRPVHLHHTGIENTLRSHPPSHSAGPYVSSEVYPLVVLPFYCCHYQGNLGEAKGSCYLINNVITELKIKHFKMWHQVILTNTCLSKTPQLS